MPHRTWQPGEEVVDTDFNPNVADQVVATYPNAPARSTGWPAPPTGAVTYLADSLTFETFNGTSWVALAAGVPHTSAVRRLVGADNSMSNPNGTFLPVAADRTALQLSFTKRRPDTTLIVVMKSTLELRSGVAQSLEVGLHNGTTFFTVARRHTQVAATTRVDVSGIAPLTGLAVGTLTWEPYITSGAAVVGLFTGTDEISYSITETL